MASKRNLYRPAQVEENVAPRRNKKTLAQGRLITSSGQPQGSVPFNASHNTSSISNVSGNVSILQQSSLVQGQYDDSLFSPRRAIPKVSEPKSPYAGGPAGSLDLSDSDMEQQSPEERSKYQKPDEVLCIDASRQTVNPDVSEVDIRIGIDKSPVKVICHTPNGHNRSLRLDVPPEKQSTNKSALENQSPAITRHINKISAITRERIKDDHIDPYTAVQSVPMSPADQRGILQSLPSNIPQPKFDDSSDSQFSLQSDLSKCDQEDRMSMISAGSDVSSMKDFSVTNHKKVDVKHTKTTKDRLLASAKKDLPKRPGTAKKKKGQFVPSRYMQAAETKTKSSLSSRFDKSSINKSNKSQKSMESTPPLRKVARHTDSTNRCRKAETKKVTPESFSHNRPHTPDNQSIASLGGKTSTPTMDGSMFTQEMDIDASAIHAETSVLSVGHMRDVRLSAQKKTRSRIQKDLRDDLMGQSVLSNASLVNQSTIASKPKQKADPKQLQQKLDLQWMYNLQWTFLEAKAKKSFQDQEKLAMAQIYGLHEEAEKLRQVKSDREIQHTRLKRSNVADHFAEVQRQCLGPVTNALSCLKTQYLCLAEALDTTRHQIPTRDIHLPDNEEHFQAKLESQLLESERLLGEISARTRQDGPTISEMATAMVTMEKAVQDMEVELKQSRELLAATESLTVSECALRVQEIQLLDQS